MYSKSGSIVKQQLTMVSVVIPTYNTRKQDLLTSLISVCAQTYEAVEIIVVDDGSGVPFSHVDQDERFGPAAVRWICLIENCGVAIARNAGVSAASSDLVAFLDAGDWWETDKLTNQVALLTSSGQDTALVYSGAIAHRARHDIAVPARQLSDYYRQLLIWQPISGSASSVLMKRSVFEKLNGFFEEYDIPEDRDLWLRVARSYEIVADQAQSVHVVETSESRSSNPAKKRISYRSFLKRHDLALTENGVKGIAYSYCDFVIAKKYYMKACYGSAAKYLVLAFLRRPLFLLRLVSGKMQRYTVVRFLTVH